MGYTYIAAGANYHKDCSEIRKSINNKIYFVGEHTICELIATTNAAYISGILASREII